MRIAAFTIQNMIDKLKTNPITRTRTSSQIYREFGNELKVMRSNIGSIVDNRYSNNKKFSVNRE